MHRLFAYLIPPVFALFLVPAGFAQVENAKATTSCDFNPNSQVAVDYQRVEFQKPKKALGHEVPYGKIWAPGGKPLALFANTPVSVDGKLLANGAYTLFVIPEEKSWTLVVSKGTDMSGNYDQAKDLLRIPMQFGELPQPETEFTAYLVHTGPDECNLRLDLAQARAWVTFRRQ